MKAKKILELTPGEMREQMHEKAQQYFELRMKKSVGQLKSPAELRQLKRDVARLQFVLSQKKEQ